MNKEFPLTIFAILIIILAPTTVFVKAFASNEGSYQMGFWSGSNSGPQNNSTLNQYPTFNNNTCSLVNSSTLNAASTLNVVLPAITNTTSCQDGWYNGFKVWCNNHSLDCVQNITSGMFPPMILQAKEQYDMGARIANGSGNLCPIGKNAVFCQGWYSNNGDESDCSDSPLANITGNLMGCFQDIATNNQIGGLGLPVLVGKWNFVNQTDGKTPITGTFLFNNDGTMRMTVPSKTGFGDYTLDGSWGTPYFSHSYHILTFGYAYGNYQNNTLTKISPNHIEFIDIHHNIIHLMRYHALPPFTPQLVPPQRNVTLLYQQGQTQFEGHNYTGALSLYNQGLAIDPHSVNILSGVAQVLEAQQNYTGAIQYLDKAFAVNPDDIFSLELKGFILNVLGEYRESLVSLDRALELTSSSIDSNVYVTLENKALDLMKLGDYEQALSVFDKAIAEQPYIEWAYYYKALTLVTFDFHTHNFVDMNTALLYLNKALKINSDNKDASVLKGIVIELLRGLS
jgi:Tfp pilus assembly protein PilF